MCEVERNLESAVGDLRSRADELNDLITAGEINDLTAGLIEIVVDTTNIVQYVAGEVTKLQLDSSAAKTRSECQEAEILRLEKVIAEVKAELQQIKVLMEDGGPL